MIDPTRPIFVSYIDKSREYYMAKGYGNPYRWAYHQDVPFTGLRKTLAESRLALVSTAGIQPGRFQKAYAAPAQPAPAFLHTEHVSWHKKATHTRDLGTFFPLAILQTLVEAGRLGGLGPRFYGAPTDFSQRRTLQEHAPAIRQFCSEDDIDLVLLVPL